MTQGGGVENLSTPAPSLDIKAGLVLVTNIVGFARLKIGASSLLAITKGTQETDDA